jgi:alpha-beta hydrolase superfamily lysophospholipase
MKVGNGVVAFLRIFLIGYLLLLPFLGSGAPVTTAQPPSSSLEKEAGGVVKATRSALRPRPAVQKLEINNQTHLAFRRFISQQPKGVILYLHGIQSHSGWYLRSCQILSENGYTVYAPDRRGCGLNEAERGHLQNYEDLIADMDAFIARIHADYPGLPVFLLGVSWGGKQALLYETMRPGRVNGLILSTPGIKPQVNLSLWNRLKVFYFFWRNREIQPEIPIPISQSSLFTDDPNWQNWIEQDPLTLRRATARFYWENRKMDKKVRKGIHDTQAPILLLLAGRDEIINNEKTIRFMSDKLPDVDPNSIQVIEYPTARHTLEFEKNMRQVVRDILKWLDRQVAGQPHTPLYPEK